MQHVYLGIDIGTTGTKAVLVTCDGRVLAHSTREYAVDTPQKGWAEQWPGTWIEAVVGAVRDVCTSADLDSSAVQAIGLSGQMHSTVLLDAAGDVVRPAIIWADQRSATQVQHVYTQIGQANLATWTGNPLATGFMLASWLWLRENEPLIEARAAHLLLPKDYVRYWLTGHLGTEPSDAASTGLFNPQIRNWSNSLLNALDLPAVKLPVVHPSATVGGTLKPEAARTLGLPTGIPVVFGGSDQTMQALGNGVVAPGTILMTVGTGGQAFAPTDRCVIDPDLRMHSFCHILPDLWHVETAMLSAGLCLKWLRDSVLHGWSYQQMADAAMEVPPGAEGLLFLPHLAGERTPYMDPHSRGAFVGLTLRHGVGHMVRAVMEGVVFTLWQGLEIMLSLGVPAERVLISGGATAHPLWRQLQADIYGRQVAVTQAPHAAAVGAAMLAAYGIAESASIESLIQTWVPQTGSIVQPRVEWVEFYSRRYADFCDLYPELTAINTTLGSMREG